jgi:hypothetical protein
MKRSKELIIEVLSNWFTGKINSNLTKQVIYIYIKQY